MVQIEYLPIVLTGIGLIVSILYYTNTLRNQAKTREAQLFLALVNGYSNYEENLRAMKLLNLEWRDFDDWEAKYGRTNDPETYAMIFSLWQFFNGIGLMLRDGLFNQKTLYDYMGFSVFLQWAKWSEIILTIRTKWNRPKYMEWFEYLYKEMTEYQAINNR